MAKTRRAKSTPNPQHDGDESALIAHMQGEIAYLRAELAKRADELARERERGDVLHREALTRIEAVTAGAGAERAGDGFRATFPVEPAGSDRDQFGLADELTASEPINRAWAELTGMLIAELGMESEAALIAAAQELGIAYGDMA